MTLARKNLAGITTGELLEKIRTGKPFFVRTRYANITRQLINDVKKRYAVRATTSQAKGGIWISPVQG